MCAVAYKHLHDTQVQTKSAINTPPVHLTGLEVRCKFAFNEDIQLIFCLDASSRYKVNQLTPRLSI